MSKINDSLFLGSLMDAMNPKFLTQNKITHIVAVGAGLEPVDPNAFKYLLIEIEDLPHCKLIVHFDAICDFIHNAIEQEKGIVLVHCFAGISRSSSSVIAYLMKYHQFNFYDARDFVKSKRPIISPNYGFINQLQDYSLWLLAKAQAKVSPKNSATVELIQTFELLDKGSDLKGDIPQEKVATKHEEEKLDV